MSSRRIVDDVPAAIDYDFVLGIERNIRRALLQVVLQQDSQASLSARCAALLQEAPVVIAQRTFLKRKYERLEAARHEIQNFGLS